MKKFVVRGQHKRSCITDASLPKKIKLESDERMTWEDEEDEHATLAEFSHPVPWQKLEAEGFDCDYAQLFSKEEADHLFNKLEEEVVYLAGAISNPFYKVKTRCCSVVEGLWLFLFQEMKQRSRCLESCATYQERWPHMETQV